MKHLIEVLTREAGFCGGLAEENPDFQETSAAGTRSTSVTPWWKRSSALFARSTWQGSDVKDWVHAPLPPVGTLVGGDLVFRQHEGHTSGPNIPIFFDWIGDQIKSPAASSPQ
jgi:hypothetical protein